MTMIKRLNKVTSLVVAAAAVTSLVPATGAMAADYKRIESEDGVIYSAIAHKDGFIIDGSIVDEDTDAVYYLANGKYTELEDVDSGAELAIYGDKYVSVDDADYYVDLTTGKVTDDDIAEDAQDDAEVALREKVKDVERYGENGSLPELKEIKGNKFAEVWYSTDSYEFDVYTDAKGNYIDADYNLGKIKVTDTTGDSVTIKNTEDEEKLSGLKVKASLSGMQYLGQDSNNIYRLATINFEGANIAKVYGKDGSAITTGESAKVTVIQKISKAQASDDIDDAKYAKTVTNYVISDEDGDVSEDVNKFVELAKEENATFGVIGGKLVVSVDNEDGTVTAQAATLKSKNGFYYLDAEEESTEDASAIAADVNGNVYRLDGGYVYKFDNTDDWNKLYKVDGSMENFSVYDENNMVLWNEDDEVYSIITGKSATTEEEKEEETTTATGWVQNADGTWNYLNAEGNKVTGWLQSPASGLWYYMDANGVMMSNGWVKDNGTWYYLTSTGAMKTGWLKDNGTWYYLQSNGAMKTGWLNDNGTWYYFNASGAMLSNTTVDGYVLGANGAWIK